MSQTIMTLYTRKGCLLCEEAKQAILELHKDWNFTLEEIDIEQSDELTEQYGLMIPVVQIDGEVAAFGQIDKFSLWNRLQKKKGAFLS